MPTPLLALALACQPPPPAGGGPAAAGWAWPDNRWPRADPADLPADLAGTGFAEGDVAPDFTLSDQHGDRVELHQFYGNIVLLDIVAAWCGACNGQAPHGQEVWEALADQGVVVVAVMQSDRAGEPPDVQDAADWADLFGLTHPVLADPEGVAGPYLEQTLGYPTLPVLGRDLRILDSDLRPYGVEAVEALLSEGAQPPG